MKNRYLYKYFFKNALHSFLFWLVLFVVVLEFLAPFLLKVEKLTSENSIMVQRMILDQLNFDLYILGFFLAPALGIVAGRALVNKEGQVLLAHRISRTKFYMHSFLFYGLILLSIWLTIVALYLLVTHLFNQPIGAELVFKLVLSLFGILLPFLWVGFFSINTNPIAAGTIYIIIFLTIPTMAQVLDQPGNSATKQVITAGLKTISLSVPEVQTFQLIASPFSKLDKSATHGADLEMSAYGLLWAAFLLVSGFLVYIRKDMVDPHS